LGKKGLSIWLFSTLTFISLLHLIEALSVLAFNNPMRLLQLYPLINEKLQTIDPLAYFWMSAASTFILWGVTCAIAFENPVETFLNKILSDAKKQTAVETQLLEDKSEIVDLMFETMQQDNEILAQVKDLMCNVRADVKEIQPLKDSVEKIRTDLTSLKKTVKKFEEATYFPNMCAVCGKPLLPEFKICPYCGQNVSLIQEKMIQVKEYR
jgi:RNA polymerase-binding transcription factor DksA